MIWMPKYIQFMEPKGHLQPQAAAKLLETMAECGVAKNSPWSYPLLKLSQLFPTSIVMQLLVDLPSG